MNSRFTSQLQFKYYVSKLGCSIGYKFDSDQNQSKNEARPKCREKRKKCISCPASQQKTKKNSIPSKAHKKTPKSQILCTHGKICAFHFPKVFLITFIEENCREKVKENNSNDTLVCDVKAHIVVLCTSSPFFCTRWVLLRFNPEN